MFDDKVVSPFFSIGFSVVFPTGAAAAMRQGRKAAVSDISYWILLLIGSSSAKGHSQSFQSVLLMVCLPHQIGSLLVELNVK